MRMRFWFMITVIIAFPANWTEMFFPLPVIYTVVMSASRLFSHSTTAFGTKYNPCILARIASLNIMEAFLTLFTEVIRIIGVLDAKIVRTFAFSRTTFNAIAADFTLFVFIKTSFTFWTKVLIPIAA